MKNYWDKYNELLQMFFEPAIDYANTVEPITFETDAELPAQQERWTKVHEAYGRGVKDTIEFILSNYELKAIEQPDSKLVDEKLSVEENQLYDMKEKIETVYKDINAQLSKESTFNDNLTKGWVIKQLREAFGTQVAISNNPPDVVDECLFIARVTWNTDYTKTAAYKYVDFIFGNPIQVSKYQNQLYMDNETFKFIQKGI